jgi:hypothetical protein
MRIIKAIPLPYTGKTGWFRRVWEEALRGRPIMPIDRDEAARKFLPNV